MGPPCHQETQTDAESAGVCIKSPAEVHVLLSAPHLCHKSLKGFWDPETCRALLEESQGQRKSTEGGRLGPLGPVQGLTPDQMVPLYCTDSSAGAVHLEVQGRVPKEPISGCGTLSSLPNLVRAPVFQWVLSIESPHE